MVVEVGWALVFFSCSGKRDDGLDPAWCQSPWPDPNDDNDAPTTSIKQRAISSLPPSCLLFSSILQPPPLMDTPSRTDSPGPSESVLSQEDAEDALTQLEGDFGPSSDLRARLQRGRSGLACVFVKSMG